MEFVVDIFKLLVSNVSIDLSSYNIFMPQKFLNHS